MAVRDQWGTPPHKLNAGSKRCTQANNTNGISWSNNVENNSRISSPGIFGTKSTYLCACSWGRTALLTISNEKLIYFPRELHDLQKLVGPYQQERGLEWSLVQKLREDWDKSNLQIVISNLSKMLCPELWQDDKIDHMTFCRHWLPVTSRTVFKLLLWPTRSLEAQLHFLWRRAGITPSRLCSQNAGQPSGPLLWELAPCPGTGGWLLLSLETRRKTFLSERFYWKLCNFATVLFLKHSTNTTGFDWIVSDSVSTVTLLVRLMIIFRTGSSHF